jgi:hypothetical protein
MEIKRSNLVLPTSGYELDEDEMSYVEGGGTLKLTLTENGLIGKIIGSFTKLALTGGIVAASAAVWTLAEGSMTFLTVSTGGLFSFCQGALTVLLGVMVNVLVSYAARGILNSVRASSFTNTYSLSAWYLPNWNISL